MSKCDEIKLIHEINILYYTAISFSEPHFLWPSLFARPSCLTETVLTSTHNLYFRAKNKKIMYTPVNPSFTIIKVGCKGVYITRTCYHDVKNCDIKRIHHWCSVGTGKSQPEGPSFQWETRLCRVSHWNGGPEGWDFPVPLYTNDRFYFSHI